MIETTPNTLPTLPREGREADEPLYPPEPLAATLDRMAELHRRFVYHPDNSTHDVAVLWAAHTHAMSTWRTTPRLYITAGEAGCGKTTQAELLALFSQNGLRAGTASTAGIVENVGKRTLLLDETDNLFTSHWDRNTMTAVINDGYLRGGHVLHKGAITPVFGPLALAGIENGRLPQATRTRTIPIQMRKPPAGSPQPEPFDPFDHEDFGVEVRWRLADATPNWTRIQAPHTLREGQLWTPLYSIAAAAGGDWLDRVQTAAAEHTWTRSYSRENAALKSSREWFQQFPESERVQSSVLADYINASQDRFTVSRKGLAGIMQGYQVEPHKISVMYYLKADLEPVWAE